MKSLEVQKLSALEIFESAIKSPITKQEYLRSLKRYFEFYNISDADMYVKQDPDSIHEHLASYINQEKSKGIKNHSIKGKINAIFLFLEMNRVILHKKILKKMLPADDEVLGGGIPFTNDDISRMLSVTDKPRSKAIIHFLASTGIRPGGIVDPVLRIKHLVDMPNNCISIRIYDGSKDGYWAFLTPEASKALKNYHQSRKINGEIFNDESPVFTNVSDIRKSKGGPISSRSVRELLYRILDTTGIEREKVGKRYDKAVIYGFRKRFNTILKINNDVNSNIAEKLMAHKRGLDGTYLQPTREECFAEFIKAIPELTISSTERQKHKIETLEIEKTELEQQKHETEKLEDKVARQDQAIHTILKKLDKIESE